jgi:bacillithiol system protein YtxJ
VHPDITELRTSQDVDRLLDQSESHPVLLLKHSYTCGTSAQALDELLSHLEERDETNVRFAMVTVQTARAASTDIAARLGVRHETPQALLIRHRKVVWQASHFRVTAEAIATAISRDATA